MMNPQIRIISLLTLVTMTIACGQNQKGISIVEGDLFFRPFRYGSFYNQPDSLVKAVVGLCDTAKVDSQSSTDKQLLETYVLLKKENRLFSPFVELRINDSSIVKLYLDSVDYERIKTFKREDLQAENKKVKIKAKSIEKGTGLFFCIKLISIDKVDGLTMQPEKKFKIDDYE